MSDQQLPYRAQHDKKENRHASPAKCFQDTASYKSPATALRRHCWPANKILRSQQYFHASSFSITILPQHTLLLLHLFFYLRGKDSQSIYTAQIDRSATQFVFLFTTLHKNVVRWFAVYPREHSSYQVQKHIKRYLTILLCNSEYTS